MNTALTWSIYAVIIVGAIGLTSCAKLLIKKYSALNTGWEYFLSLLSFALAGGGAILWLYYYAAMDWEAISVFASLAAAATYIVYLLLFQGTRKLGLQLLAKLFHKGTDTSVSTDTETAEDTATATETTEPQGSEALQAAIDALKKYSGK